MKEQYELEYPLNCSPKVLFPRISTPEGLSEWFADEVNADGDIFTFRWDKSKARAQLTSLRENKLARFEWLGREKEKTRYYFEFRINVEELTGDVALIITDFAEHAEKEDSIHLWDTEIQKLKSALGS